jgi:hypothetical protein
MQRKWRILKSSCFLLTTAFLKTLFLLLFVSFSTLAQVNDTLTSPLPDNLKINQATEEETADFKSKIEYHARDSLFYDSENMIVYLYGNAVVKYENMELKAGYISVDLENKTLLATYVRDSAGNKSEIPEFIQNSDRFTADEIKYNFKTGKGRIRGVYTEQGEGYIYGETVKKIDDFEYISRGTYTTCNLPHPHYAIAASKLKVINNRKIITGPAYLTVADVPLPLAIPFGYFPNRKGQSSGIIFPAYGESTELGFFLKNGGYYFGINDYLDLALTGDLYSKGSYAAQSFLRYAWRYHYSGNLSFSYSKIKTGDKELPDFSENRDFFVRWSHTQDPKAHPNHNFSANVNAGSSQYFRNNISTPANFLTNTFQSSVSWTKSFPGKPFHFSATASHSQNTQTRDMNISFPQFTFSVNRIYPFKRKRVAGVQKWYEKAGLSYQGNFQNVISGKDTSIFKGEWTRRLRNGVQHSIPISTSWQVLKYITFTPSINYSEKWYLSSIEKRYDISTNSIITDTVSGFKAAREFNAGASFNTRVYGIFQFRNSKLQAIRHVVSPTLSFTYRPDFSDPFWNNYKTVQTNPEGETVRYSIYEQSLFGGPAAGKQALIGFAIDNNLEMKIRTDNDTTSTTKKFKIFESLVFSGNYNLAADSLKLSILNLAARTTFFDRMNLNTSMSFDPYITDSLSRRINISEWNENRRIGRLTSASLAAGFNVLHNPKPSTGKQQTDATTYEIPFSLQLSYSLYYIKPSDYTEKKVTQTINFSGDLSLTRNWKITYSSGYDFTLKKWSYTSLSFYRDLHCWEMRFNWVPLGGFTYWNFQINVKAPVLQDLKLTKKKDYYDQ